MNSTFFEQLGGVAGMFDQWGACERTMVACALARKVPWSGLKILQRAVDAALRQHSDDARGDFERDANDELLLASLLNKEHEDEGAEHLRQLLALLPLLRADNERAKEVYMTAAPALVQRYVDARRRLSLASDLCRQLLTYLLVHPALTHHDQRALTPWLRYLESHISGYTLSETLWNKNPVDPSLLPNTNIWGSGNAFRRTIGKNVEFKVSDVDTKYPETINESFSKNGRDVDIAVENKLHEIPKSHRSNSLTPPTTNFIQMSSSSENLSEEAFVQKPRSFSLSSEHSLGQIRPMSIQYGTTGSETRLDDLRCGTFVEYPGMSMVAQWLKSLRLHKYVWLFTNITYEQMMAMDEEYLEKLGVTKGARHKLLLSIQRLNERMATLNCIEVELQNGASTASTAKVLEKLRDILISPMPPASDIPESIVRILDVASHKLTSAGCNRRPPGAPLLEDEEACVDPMSLHCWLVETALHHESFASKQLQSALHEMRHRLPPRQFFHYVSDMPLNRRVLKQRTVNGFMRSRATPPEHLPPWLPATGPPRPRGNSHAPCPPRAPSTSAPSPRAPSPRAPSPRAPPSPAPFDDPYDEYSSLDALCLQMMETAIN